MSERCERTSERRSEWPSTLRVDFIVILPMILCQPTHEGGESEFPSADSFHEINSDDGKDEIDGSNERR